MPDYEDHPPGTLGNVDLNDFRNAVFGAQGGLAESERTYADGEIVFRPGDAADEMYVVTSGRFEERTDVPGRASHRLWLLNKRDICGDVALLADLDGTNPVQRRTCVRSLATDARLACLKKENVRKIIEKGGFATTRIIQGLAGDALRMFEDERSFDLISQSYFDGPAAHLSPAPFVARGVEMYLFYLQTPPGSVRQWLPGGVRPFPGMENLALLVFAHFPHLSQPARPKAIPFRYNETAIFVPCLMRPSWSPVYRPAVYSPAVYPDNQLAVLLGREIFGFRKRPARTYLTRPKAGSKRGALRLFVDGATNARVRFDDDSLPMDDFWSSAPTLVRGLGSFARCLGLDLSSDGLSSFANRWRCVLPSVPVVSVKQIPAPEQADGHIRYDVNQLCLSPFLLLRVSDLSAVGGDVRLSITNRVPFAGSELAAPVGLHFRVDMALLSSRTLRRYPCDTEPIPIAQVPRGPIERAMDYLGVCPSQLLERIELLRNPNCAALPGDSKGNPCFAADPCWGGVTQGGFSDGDGPQDGWPSEPD